MEEKNDGRGVLLDFPEPKLPKIKYNPYIHNPYSYSISVYTKSSRRIGVFSCIAAAARETGISHELITKSLNDCVDIGDLVFVYSNESIKEKLKIVKDSLPIREYTLQGVLVRPWRNPIEAARAYNLRSNDILRCARGERLTVGGRIFLLINYSIKARLFRLKKEKKK